MNYQTVHKKFVGKIQLNTFAYEKEVFKIIVDRLIQSNIFHSVCTQRINHCSANKKRATCNCNEILEYIAKEFRAEAERFAQLFVPLVIIDYQSKIRHYLICELLYFYDKLLKPRKEFFIEDVKEKALFKSYKYNENCVCQLHEILSLENNSSKPSKHSHASKVNNTCLHEVMKELVSHKLLPLSSKCLPLDSFRLQKILDICNKYYLPDDMIVKILNNLSAVKSDHNQSNMETDQFLDSSIEYDVSGSYNRNKVHFDCKMGEMRSGSTTSGSVKKSSANKSQKCVGKDEMNSSNIYTGPRVPQTGNPGLVYRTMENCHNRSYSPLRYSRTSGNPKQSYGKSSINRDSNAWKTFQDKSYRPTSRRTSLEPQIASGYRSNPLKGRSNFHWQTDSQSRSTMRPGFQRQSDAYLDYNDYRESTRGAGWPDYGDRCDSTNVYEVVIDDECCDLDNVETITVRDGDGNCRTYIDSDRISPATRRPVDNGGGSVFARRPQKRVSFASPGDCATGTVTRAVLCQEANSMDALLAVLDKQVDKEDGHPRQCMRLSVHAEHVIKRPECPGEPVPLRRGADDCLTISSEVQAKWENFSCDEDSRPGGLSTVLPKQSSLHPGSHSRATSPLALSIENISELCDKAMQTEKFLFLETCTERIVLSPTNLDCRNPTSVSTGTVAMNPRLESRKSLANLRPTGPFGCENAGGQFYFYEDCDRRLICSPSDLCVDRPTQTGEPSPLSPVLYPGSNYRPNGYLKLPNRSYVPPSVGDYYLNQQRFSDDFNSKYNISILDDPRFGRDTLRPSSTAYYEPNDPNSQSRPYSLHPYSESLAPPPPQPPPAPPSNGQENSQNQQINYSSSCNYSGRQNHSSSEDIFYIESRKLSPIIDIDTYCQYNNNPLVNGQRFRNSIKDQEISRNITKRPLRYLNSSQRNNSNLIGCYDDIVRDQRRTNWRGSPTIKRSASNENVWLDSMRDLLRKTKCPHKTLKITKYTINYPLRYGNKLGQRDFQDKDGKLNRKNRLKWNCINSTIPIISAINKSKTLELKDEIDLYLPNKKSIKSNKNKKEHNSKHLHKNLKIHSNSFHENINPYEKSIDYLNKKYFNKKKLSNKTSKCISNNYEINIVHSCPNINKLDESGEVEEFKEKKKKKKMSLDNLLVHEKLDKSEDAKFVILKYGVDMNCDSDDLKPRIYKYQPSERKFFKIEPTKIAKCKSHSVQHKKYTHNSRNKLERKFSEVEVDFNPI